MSLAQILRTARNRADLSEAALGDLVGVTGGYISMLEEHERLPDESMLRLITGALQMSPESAREAIAALHAEAAAMRQATPEYVRIADELF
jgi:transcriptional regulator with XRE-family HTH domain